LEDAQSQPKPRPNPTPKPAIKKLRSRTYNYVSKHDLNYDGKVDIKDRLIWLRDRKNYDAVYVSTDNEDLVEIMDADGDGNVERWEVDLFYDKYDLNKNGILEDAEVDAATE
jgi:hypothetical protein